MNYENAQIFITDHAKIRLKERFGISNDTTQKKWARRALIEGVNLYDIPTTYPYVRVFPKLNHIYQVREEILYIFEEDREVENKFRLVTVYKLPKAFLT